MRLGLNAQQGVEWEISGVAESGPGAWSKLMKAESTGHGQAPAGYLLASPGRAGATEGGALMPCQRTRA